MNSTYRAEPYTDPLAHRTTVPALPLRRVSWGAIFAGMVIAIVVQLVLSLIGAGIGLSTIDPLRSNGMPDASTFGMGAMIWWALSSIVALFVGGWVAGHLAGLPERTDGMLHGLLAWGLATLLTVYLLASAIGAVVRGGASVVGTAANVTATGAAAAAGPIADAAQRQLERSGISIDSLKSEVGKLLAQTDKPALQPDAITSQASAAAGRLSDATATAGSNGTAAADDVQSAMKRIVASGKDTVEQVDREALVNVVMARANVSRAEAEQRVDGWIKSYENARATIAQKSQQAEAKARDVADATTKASSKGALGAAAALILGAIAAALGGMSARRRGVVA